MSYTGCTLNLYVCPFPFVWVLTLFQLITAVEDRKGPDMIQQIVSIGLKYNLATSQTSFIVVDRDTYNNADNMIKAVVPQRPTFGEESIQPMPGSQSLLLLDVQSLSIGVETTNDTHGLPAEEGTLPLFISPFSSH